VNPDGVTRSYSAQKKNVRNFYDNGTTFSNTIALHGGNEAVNFRFPFPIWKIKALCLIQVLIEKHLT